MTWKPTESSHPFTQQDHIWCFVNTFYSFILNLHQANTEDHIPDSSNLCVKSGMFLIL